MRIYPYEADILEFFEDIGIYSKRKVFYSEAVWDKHKKV
jgi:hypothetical protein